MVMAVPIMSRARPDLIASGRYFVATDDDHVVGAGGWSTRAASERTSIKGIGHVRHVVTDYRHQRQGIGRALMTAVMADARAAGMAWMDCMSTRTAVSFYESLGFRVVQTVDVPLGPGIVFPAIRMLGAL